MFNNSKIKIKYSLIGVILVTTSFLTAIYSILWFYNPFHLPAVISDIDIIFVILFYPISIIWGICLALSVTRIILYRSDIINYLSLLQCIPMLILLLKYFRFI